jgi:hypothetical protein
VGRAGKWRTFFAGGVEVYGFEKVVHCLDAAGRRTLHMFVVVVVVLAGRRWSRSTRVAYR